MIPQEISHPLGTAISVFTIIGTFYLTSKIARNMIEAFKLPPRPIYVTNNYRNCHIIDPEVDR